jgi:hypothetical protein
MGLPRACLWSHRKAYHSASLQAKTWYAWPVVRSARSAKRLLALPALLLLSGACGRRATHADCQLIVDRTVEIELAEKNQTDPAAIAKRKAEVRAELDEDLKSCERERRVTDKMMACVQSASTTSDLRSCLQ